MAFGDRYREIRRKRLVRKAIVRWVSVVLVLLLLPLKPLKFLHPLAPGRLKGLLRDWDAKMMAVYVFSAGRRAYIDQPCQMKDPESFKPLVETEPQFRLTEEQIAGFYENGFVGPFTLCAPEEMAAVREEIMRDLERPSEIYGDGPQRARDRHLDCARLWRLISSPALTERLAQILGPNLLLWRSQVFLKQPGAPEITWHQASTYLSEEAFKATLFPPDRDRLFQLTTWLAFDDVDLANGCLQFVRGTHRKIQTIRLGGKDAESFAQASIKLEYDIRPEQVASMEMKAGQFVVFTERVIHGSPPNRSDRRRWGMAFRAIQPDVKVYDDDLTHNVRYLKQQYDLSKWGAVVLRGEDTAGVNRILLPPTERQPAETIGSASVGSE